MTNVSRQRAAASAAARRLAAIMLGAAVPACALAAERDPVLEAVQAHCIQEGMVRGFSGESLKEFVARCTETRRHAPPPDLRPFAAEPAAC